jgi:hypothetical protein
MYYKSFETYDHLVTLLFTTVSGMNSLRELSGVMLACQGKINHTDRAHHSAHHAGHTAHGQA